MFHQITSTPWEVPKRRKNRGYNKHYFDSSTEELMTYSSGEVSTANRFEVLVDCPTEEEDIANERNSPSRMKTEEINSSPSEGALQNGHTLFNDYNDFFFDLISLKLYKKSFTSFMYCNSINFCSGYFPDLFKPINNIS